MVDGGTFDCEYLVSKCGTVLTSSSTREPKLITY